MIIPDAGSMIIPDPDPACSPRPLSHLSVRQTSGRQVHITVNRVANPGCLSQIPGPNFFDPGSEFFRSRILDPHKRISVFEPKKLFLSPSEI